MHPTPRRQFLTQSLCLGAAAVAARPLAAWAAKPGSRMRFGMVTYQWGKDWDVPTLIANCTQAGVQGVELRTSHAHGVEPSIGPAERAEVRKRFQNSPVTLVGMGTAEEFHSPDPKALEKAIENTKAFVLLSRDVGGSGVKVRPNALPKEVPQEKTIEQIGKALNVVGAFAADYGQQIRLEIHGGCAKIPIIKQIMDVATHPNVYLCWNSNKSDTDEPGLEANFNSVKARLGGTTHVRTFDSKDYPWPELFKLFVQMDYAGWILLEAGTKVDDRIAGLIENRKQFEQMVAQAQG
jgi:sugar phosphate isomerase/epimerase